MLAREVRLSQVLCPHSDPLPVTEYVKALDNITYETYKKQRNIQAEEQHFDGAIHTPINVGDMVLIQKPSLDCADIWIPEICTLYLY